ncbi:MAG: DUF5076 domain-containing protein [Hyphomicrobiaceae bacterium]
MTDDDEIEELDLPDGIREADQAIEVIRAWIADGQLNVIFDPETFKHDASEWGRLLSDIAHHVSHAVELDGQMSRHEAIAAIREAFDTGADQDAITMMGKIKGRTEH